MTRDEAEALGRRALAAGWKWSAGALAMDGDRYETYGVMNGLALAVWCEALLHISSNSRKLAHDKVSSLRRRMPAKAFVRLLLGFHRERSTPFEWNVAAPKSALANSATDAPS